MNITETLVNSKDQREMMVVSVNVVIPVKLERPVKLVHWVLVQLVHVVFKVFQVFKVIQVQ